MLTPAAGTSARRRRKRSAVFVTVPRSIALQLLLLTALTHTTDCLDVKPRRDWLWKTPVAAGVTYFYAKTFRKAYQFNHLLVYPELHETRLQTTLTSALSAAAATASSKKEKPFRILEIGVGSDCRLLRRGFYQAGLQHVRTILPQALPIEMYALDLKRPPESVLQQAQERLNTNTELHVQNAELNKTSHISLRFVPGDLTQGISNFPDGYFDTIVGCTVLCSVADPLAAVQEIHRLVRPHGGTYGYLEHVAVELETDTDSGVSFPRFLEQQQLALDPLQQTVAGNCHLHRRTAKTIQSVFQNQPHGSHSNYIEPDQRFFVPEMWPVSVQCCGVLQLA